MPGRSGVRRGQTRTLASVHPMRSDITQRPAKEGGKAVGAAPEGPGPAQPYYD